MKWHTLAQSRIILVDTVITPCVAGSLKDTPPIQWRCDLTPYSQKARLNYLMVGSFWGHSISSQWTHKVSSHCVLTLSFPWVCNSHHELALSYSWDQPISPPCSGSSELTEISLLTSLWRYSGEPIVSMVLAHTFIGSTNLALDPWDRGHESPWDVTEQFRVGKLNLLKKCWRYQKIKKRMILCKSRQNVLLMKATMISTILIL